MPVGTPSEGRVQAVQYLRMSTEHQRYSLENQAAVIATYALEFGFEIVATYADPGRSGLKLAGRPGLQSLLAAALQRDRNFSAILVLDVSRWGRFQDADEAAHYEFLCRSAGVRVVYCGEGFAEDGGFVATIAKNLKRAMAAEFSRELSQKVMRAQRQGALLGFWQGGPVCYGFQRVLLDKRGREKCILAPAEMKAMRDERVIVRPGPADEVAVIRRTFRLYVGSKLSTCEIAARFNAEGLPHRSGKPWTAERVRSILRNELSIGWYVWNRTDQNLRKGRRRRPRSEWVRIKVGKPLVPVHIFRQAQTMLHVRTRHAHFSDAEMLAALRELLSREGRLATRLLRSDPCTPSDNTYRGHFGSLARAYELAGYVREPVWRVRSEAVRTDEAVIEEIQRIHSENGYVSARLIEADPRLPAINALYRHFGSLKQLYERAGLGDVAHQSQVKGTRRGQALRRERILRPTSEASG